MPGLPALPGEMFQRSGNGSRTSGHQPRVSDDSSSVDGGRRPTPPQGGSGLPSGVPSPQSPPPVAAASAAAVPVLKNHLLSYIGDLAETDDVLSNLSQVEGPHKTKLEFCRDRVQRVKDALLRTAINQH